MDKRVSAEAAGDAIATSIKKKKKKNPEDSAREFLESRPRAPWDEPIGEELPKPKPRPTPKPAEKPKSGTDELADKAESFAARNRDIAKRTRHLRED